MIDEAILNKTVEEATKEEQIKRFWQEKAEIFNPIIKQIEEIKPEEPTFFIKMIANIQQSITHSAVQKAYEMNISELDFGEIDESNQKETNIQIEMLNILKSTNKPIKDIMQVLELYSKTLDNSKERKLIDTLTYEDILPKNAINVD